jgi:hypothetical protein
MRSIGRMQNLTKRIFRHKIWSQTDSLETELVCKIATMREQEILICGQNPHEPLFFTKKLGFPTGLLEISFFYMAMSNNLLAKKSRVFPRLPKRSFLYIALSSNLLQIFITSLNSSRLPTNRQRERGNMREKKAIHRYGGLVV